MTKRILIVDPHPEIALLIQNGLENFGHNVLVAADLEQAHELLLDEVFHLLLVETVLPGGSGLKLAANIRNNPILSNVPIVLLDSQNSDSELTIDEARRACGAEALFRLPLSLDPFIRVLGDLSGRLHAPRRYNPARTTIAPGSSLNWIRTIYDSRWTGRLEFTTRQTERSFHFYEGSPVSSASSEETERLGQTLVRLDFIDQRELNSLLEEQKTNKLRLGRLAIRRGLIDKLDLSLALNDQLVNNFGALCREETGTLSLVPEEPTESRALKNLLHPFELIRAGVKAGPLYNLPDGDSYLIPLDTPSFRLHHLSLKPEELSCILRLDGSLTFNELCRFNDLKEKECRALVAGLLVAKMVKTGDQPVEPSGLFQLQAKQSPAEKSFAEEFFRNPWDRTDPGIDLRQRPAYKLLKETKKDKVKAQGLFAASKTNKDGNQWQARNPGWFLFGSLAVVSIISFLLFLLSARPFYMAQHMDRMLAMQQTTIDETEKKVARPIFISAKKHYEKGLALMSSNNPVRLKEAVEQFVKALSIDKNHHQALAALKETLDRLERIEKNPLPEKAETTIQSAPAFDSTDGQPNNESGFPERP